MGRPTGLEDRLARYSQLTADNNEIAGVREVSRVLSRYEVSTLMIQVKS
jgi:hypothetical protein